jgi:hypothetical protein
MSISNPEIVNVPVPVYLLPAVYEVLARGTSSERGPARATTTARPNELATPRRFTNEELKVLKHHLPAGNPRRQFLDRIAASPETWVGYDEVIEATGISDAQLRGQLSAFTGLLSRLFRNTEWPVKWVRGIGGKNQIYYWMEKEIADAWILA